MLSSLTRLEHYKYISTREAELEAEKLTGRTSHSNTGSVSS